MKKIKNIMYFSFMSLFMIMILGACGNKHIHEYGNTHGYDSTNHWNTCSCGEIGNISEHYYGEWITIREATQYSEGRKKQVCNVCTYENFVEIQKIEHIHEYTTELILPTCETSGYTIHTCSCGDTYNDNEVSALEHNYVEEITVKATCTQHGIKTYTCSHDSTHTYTEEILALEHNYVNEVCSNCKEQKPTDGLEFALLSDGTYSVTKYKGTSTNVIIPSIYNSIPVTIIGDRAFNGCSKLTNVVLSENLISIGTASFAYCTSLEKITIPESVTSIGEWAFSASGIKNIVIPKGVTNISNGMFGGCTNLSKITFQDGLRTIGDYAFNGCTYLSYVILPEGVTNIGKEAFTNITHLSIVIPKSLKNVGEKAFDNCYHIKIYYKGSLYEWSYIKISPNNMWFTDTTRYYYSETKPTTSGNYWHYSSYGNGYPTIW